MAIAPVSPIALDFVIDFLICALIVFVHKGLLDSTPFNAELMCVFALRETF